MVFVTLLVTGIFLVLALGSGSLISYFESKPQLTVFFKDDKDKESIDAFIQKIRSTDKVSKVEFISKEQALSIYKEQNKNDPLLLEMVTAEILPSSVEISATAPEYLNDLSEVVKKEPGVDEVVFQKEVVDTLISWTTTLRKVGIVFIVFLLLSTIFILLTTIGMKIALRKEEVEILTLIGASSFYIRKPFVSEGIFYGFVGSIAASLVITLGLMYLQPFAMSFLKGIPELNIFTFGNLVFTIWPPNLYFYALIWGVILTSGIIIGLIGSTFALSRYLK
jgi:cell division transport system permease protein